MVYVAYMILSEPDIPVYMHMLKYIHTPPGYTSLYSVETNSVIDFPKLEHPVQLIAVVDEKKMSA